MMSWMTIPAGLLPVIGLTVGLLFYVSGGSGRDDDR